MCVCACVCLCVGGGLGCGHGNANESVPVGVFWGMLRKHGISGPLLQASQSLYNGNKSLVCTAGKISDCFPVWRWTPPGLPYAVIFQVAGSNMVLQSSVQLIHFYVTLLIIVSLLSLCECVFISFLPSFLTFAWDNELTCGNPMTDCLLFKM